MFMLHKVAIFILPEDSPLLILMQQDAMLWTILWIGPHGEELKMASDWHPKDLSSATYEDLNATTNHISLEVDSSPVELQMRPQL